MAFKKTISMNDTVVKVFIVYLILPCMLQICCVVQIKLNNVFSLFSKIKTNIHHILGLKKMNFSVLSIPKWRRPTTQYCKRIYYGQEKFTAGRSVPPSLRNRSRSSRKSILAASTLSCDPHVYSNNGIFL